MWQQLADLWAEPEVSRGQIGLMHATDCRVLCSWRSLVCCVCAVVCVVCTVMSTQPIKRSVVCCVCAAVCGVCTVMCLYCRVFYWYCSVYTAQ